MQNEKDSEINKTKYKHPLSRRMLITCAIFVIFICITLEVLGSAIYCDGMLKNYEKYMNGILNYALTEIDGDDLEKCINSGEKSQAYEKAQDALNRIKENYEIEYIYIVKPLNTNEKDNMMDVMAGVTKYEQEHETDSLTELGKLTGDSYSSGIAAHYLDRMKGDTKEVTYFGNETEFGFDYTGVIPIVNSKKEAVAVLGVDISINEIQRVLIKYLVIVMIEMVVIIALFLTLLYKWIKNRIINPVLKIQKAAQNFVGSSHEKDNIEDISLEDPHIKSGDEIQELSESIVTMASDIKTYMKNLMIETKEKERIGAELTLATKIQADMLPSIFPVFTGKKEYNVYATMNPAKEVGGDFYDLFMVDKTHLAVVMADVSGKGVPAALFMVIGKTLIKEHTKPGELLGDVFSEVNNILCSSNSEDLFITAFEGVLDLVTGEFRYVNAGHEIPYIYRRGTTFEPYKVKAGFVLAGMENMKYTEGSIQLEVGDKVFLYTDGVPEATNADNELYGSDRLYEVLNKNKELTTEDILPAIKEDVDKFVGEAEQFDDLTMLCLEYTEKMNPDEQ